MEQINKNNPNDEIDLSEIGRVIKRRKLFVGITFSLFFTLQVGFTIYQRIFNPIYRGSFKLLISDPLNEQKNSGIGNEMIESLARNETSNDIPTLIELLKSPVILNDLARKYDISSNDLINNIDIKSGGIDRRDKRADGILIINFTGDDKKKGFSLLKDLSKVYLETALNQRRQKLKDGLDFLNKQAPDLEKKVANLQSQLAIFRQNNSLLEPNEEGLEIKKVQSEFDIEIMRLKSDTARFEAVLEGLKNGNLNVISFDQFINATAKDNQGKPTGLAISNSDQGLLTEILNVQNELAAARSKYQPESKFVKSLENRLKQLKPILLENQIEAVETALRVNQSSIKSLVLQSNMLRDSFSKQPDLIKEYETIKQKLIISEQNLSGLISARENFQLEMAQNSFPWKIIENPFMYSSPIKPNLKKNFLLAIFYSSILAVLAGFIRDRNDYVFHNSKEIEDELKVPILANIPFVDVFKGVREKKISFIDNIANISGTDNKDLSNREKYQRFFYQESLRSLYTSIRFLGSDEEFKIIEVSSSVPAEGKSLINLLLAKTLSELDKKVLLIDSDLRKPTMHERLKLNNIIGLSNLLTDSKLELKNVVQKVKGFDNWSVLTSGTKVPDPTLLFSSKRMKEINEELRDSNEYDLVIYDTAPIMGLSDALLISENCDGIILVVSLNNVDRSIPKQTINKVNATGSKVLGLVTNNNIKDEEGSLGSNDYTYATYASYIDDSEFDKSGLKSDKLSKLKLKISNFFQIILEKLTSSKK
ncbi:MAG: polysaccharide biosynthesis tyrosine autokinase [Prochlorococcus marinus CUG1437]|nr:polysaccharide biosynthesis tyrosine autokinase [Prochlorococcus marinus CUG1437]